MSSNTNIIDIRTIADFKTVSFSGYKIADVRKCMYNDLLQQKLESVIHWSTELIVSGHISDVWNILVIFISRHILLANPKLSIYLESKYNDYRILIKNDAELGVLEIRNNMSMRELIAEICAVILFSPRKPGIESVKIDKEDEFNIYSMSAKCYAPDTSFAQQIIRKNDPKELWIAINELSYHIHESEIHKPDMMKAIHWVEWVLEFNVICKRNKTKCVCEPRTTYSVDSRYQSDIIWLLWDTLILYAEKRDNKIVGKIVRSLAGLFGVEYNETVAKKRKSLLYFAMNVLTEPVIDMSIRIIDNINIAYCNVAIEKIHEIYRDKKSSEKGTMKYLYDASVI